METLVRRLALAVGLICGLLGTQGPEYAQQYRQRLAGAIDELTRIVATFNDEAKSHALTPAEAIARLKTNADPLARERGVDIEFDMIRLDRLKAAFDAFKNGGAWARLVALAEDFDPTTARLAWKDFEPAVPTTAEAFGVGLVALIWGWGTTHVCAWPVRRRIAKRRAEAV